MLRKPLYVLPGIDNLAALRLVFHAPGKKRRVFQFRMSENAVRDSDALTDVSKDEAVFSAAPRISRPFTLGCFFNRIYDRCNGLIEFLKRYQLLYLRECFNP